MKKSAMERPIDQIKKAEGAMRELLELASELRRQVEIACEKNPEQAVELIKAASGFEREVQRIKDCLQQWRQGIQ